MEFLVYGNSKVILMSRGPGIKTRTASGDVTTAQRHATLCTNEVETTEVVALAEGLLFAIGYIDREELGSHNFSAVLGSK